MPISSDGFEALILNEHLICIGHTEGFDTRTICYLIIGKKTDELNYLGTY